MEPSNIIRVTVTQIQPGISANGFGTLLGLVANPAFSEPSKTYFTKEEGAADYPNVNSAERRFLDTVFTQQPSVKSVKLAPMAKPTLRYKLTAVNPTSFASTQYKLNVKFGNTSQTVTFTSDASPTDAEWAAGIVTALNGVAGKNYTASGSASPVTVVADNPGDYFAIEVVNRRHIAVDYDAADPGITASLDAVLALDPAFDAIYVTQGSKAIFEAASAWAQTNNRLYGFDTPETKSLTTTVGTGNDAGDVIHTAEARLTAGMYYSDPSRMMFAALMSVCLPRDPGSETWMFKQLIGVPVMVLTEAERANLRARNMGSYESVRGTSITYDGRTASGSYLDIQRGLLWFIDQLQTDAFNMLAAASADGKVPYDKNGRSMLLGSYKSTIKKGLDRGFVSEGTPGSTTDPEPSVTMLPLADVPDAERALRNYPDTVIAFRALGAVQSADVELIMSV